MGGRYQGGVGDGMGSFRLVGPNGRDQTYIPTPHTGRILNRVGRAKTKIKTKLGGEGTRVRVSGLGLAVGEVLAAGGTGMRIPGWVVAEWVLRCRQVLYLRRGNRY